jgi:hypothetical protein
VAIVLGSATILTNPVTGANTVTFGTPVAVTKGTLYWLGISHDVTANVACNTSTAAGRSCASVPYASFPLSSPSGQVTSQQMLAFTVNITTTISTEFVSEVLQDASTSYVSDSTVGHADLYNIAAIGSTPASVIAVTTRGMFEKSDAGARNAAVQLKSGATTVQSTPSSLNTSWGWLWRTDAVDPATGAAWTAAAVNAAQIGPIITT